MPISRTPHSPVDEYVTELSRALGGSRRRRADLVQEARDSLEDATEAYQADGLSRPAAEARAVADFGELAEVAPGYRAELAISEGRRTATALCLVLMAQPIVWMDNVWTWDTDDRPPTGVSLLLDQLVKVTGMIAILGAVLAVIALGIGLRYPAVRDRVTRWTARFVLGCAVLVSLIGIGLSSASAPAGIADFTAVGVFVLIPLTFVGCSAVRTLRLARA